MTIFLMVNIDIFHLQRYSSSLFASVPALVIIQATNPCFPLTADRKDAASSFGTTHQCTLVAVCFSLVSREKPQQWQLSECTSKNLFSRSSQLPTIDSSFCMSSACTMARRCSTLLGVEPIAHENYMQLEFGDFTLCSCRFLDIKANQANYVMHSDFNFS